MPGSCAVRAHLAVLALQKASRRGRWQSCPILGDILQDCAAAQKKPWVLTWQLLLLQPHRVPGGGLMCELEGLGPQCHQSRAGTGPVWGLEEELPTPPGCQPCARGTVQSHQGGFAPGACSAGMPGFMPRGG